jgi:hypothetical protein
MDNALNGLLRRIVEKLSLESWKSSSCSTVEFRGTKIQTRHVGRIGRFFFFPEPVEAYTYDFWKDYGVIIDQNKDRHM